MAKLSDAEWRVMGALWAGHPATARELLARVEDETGWAYTTLKTLLARLVDKGAATVEMVGRTSVYTPQLDRQSAQRSALRALVDRAFDGTFGSLIHHLVDAERLSARERQELAELLAREED